MLNNCQIKFQIKMYTCYIVHWIFCNYLRIHYDFKKRKTIILLHRTFNYCVEIIERKDSNSWYYQYNELKWNLYLDFLLKFVAIWYIWPLFAKLNFAKCNKCYIYTMQILREYFFIPYTFFIIFVRLYSLYFTILLH